jgi:hypothetical protein
MTLEEMYTILESKTYHEKGTMRRFGFTHNSIHIDRRALIPFSIYKENECFILDPDTAITEEKELRIEISAKSNLIEFYGKNSGERLLTLES